MSGVSILIPTHNRSAVLAQTLESIAQLAFPPEVPVEVVVVANACSDDTEEVARRTFASFPIPGLCVSEGRPNQNVARNAAVRSSKHEILALLDDDVWVERDWLLALVEAFRNPAVGAVAGSIELWWKDVPRPDWFTPAMDRLLTCKEYGAEPKRLCSPYDAAGANFAFRREVYDAVGPFLEGLDRTGANVGLSAGESEFLQRALSAGFQMVFHPGVHVKHWAAPQRVNEAYLERVAYANGASRVLIKPHYGWYGLVRFAFGTIAMYFVNRFREAWYWLRGNRSMRVLSHIRAAGLRGAAYGMWMRLSGRSPITKSAGD